MRTSPYLPSAAAAIVACLALAGCSRGAEDLQARIDEIKTMRGAPLEPLPVMKTFEVFEYKSENLRDPFGVAVEQALAQPVGPRPDMNRPRESLEAFPLDSLEMVGTLGLTSDVTGLVKDPDGVIHRVRPDNYIGQSFGRIISIYEDRIELVELIPNGVGGWIERPASIALGEQ